MLVQLARATEEARRADVWMTAAEVVDTHAVAPATLSRWCRQHGVGQWARRDGREWMIHIPSFRVWLSTQRESRSAA